MKWISIKDKEPDIDVHVLLFDADEKACVGYKSPYTGYNHHPMGDFATGAPLFNVLYWMPLPKPPKEI